MEKTTVATENDILALADELSNLRRQLENETARVAKLRDVYDAECRRLPHGDDAEVFAAKQRLDVATSRIEGKKAEIAQKERLLDQAQGREADENRRRDAQQRGERAREELSSSQAELARLRADYLALAEKMRVAEWRVQQALRGLDDLGH
jgi:chromosome segregation ATPase